MVVHLSMLMDHTISQPTATSDFVKATPNSRFRYASFMSYSHAADGRLAPALQRALQRLGKPWYRRPSIRVFRDETSLSANPGLWSAIQSALELCEYFLLMCSPQAAASPWVQKEVEWWLTHRPSNRLLLVITEGEVAWNAADCDFDWARTNCIPRFLSRSFREEPYYIDLRWARNQYALSLRNVRFRTAALTLAATLHGKPMEELESEDLRQQRSFHIAALVTAAVVLTLAVSAYLSYRSSQIAGQQARSSGRLADSRRMAAKAASMISEHGDLHQAILVGALAWRLAPTDEAGSVLTQLAKTTTDVARIVGMHATEGVNTKAFTVAADGSPLLVTEERNGTLMFWHIPGGELAGPPLATGHTGQQHLIFSADGSKMLSTEGFRDKAGGVLLWDLRSRTSMSMPVNYSAQTLNSDSYPGRVSLSPSGRYVATFDNTYVLPGKFPVPLHTVAVWDTVAGYVAATTLALPGNAFALSFIDDDSLLLLIAPPTDHDYLPGGRYKGPLSAVWRRSTNQIVLGPRTVETKKISSQNSVRFSADASQIVLFNYQLDPVIVYGRDTSGALHPVTVPGYAGMDKGETNDDVSLSATGHRLVAGWNDHTYVWDLQQNVLLKTLDGVESGTISRDGRWLAARQRTIGNQHVTVWDLNRIGAQGATVNASCDSNVSRNTCLKLLCEKATPLLNSDGSELRNILGDREADRLTKLALGRPCKDEQTELWMSPAAMIVTDLLSAPSRSRPAR